MMIWNDGINPTYARHDAVTLPPPAQPPESRPATQSTVAQPSVAPLNLVQPWKAPVLNPVRAPVALPPVTPESSRGYTDETLAAARASQQLADKMKRDLGNTKQEDDPTAWTLYNTRAEVAAEDWATVDQAMAAELRLTYQANPTNKGATQSAATDLAARYGGDPVVQTHAGKALNTVLNETALQRDTGTKLYDLHRAASKLDGLIAKRQDGGSVSDQDIATARADYLAQQKLVLAAVEPELRDAVEHLPTIVQLKESDLEGYAARGILSRYQDDPEFNAVLQAAVVISKTVPFESVGPEAQMQKLGELTPASLDPSARQLVMNDPRIKPVVDRYVDWAAQSVNASYDKATEHYVSDFYKDLDHNPDRANVMATGTPPALAASERLVQVTDYNERPYVTPQIAARIVNKLRTEHGADGSTPLGKVVADLGANGKHSKELLEKDGPPANTDKFPTYDKVISNLSLALDNVSRGSDIQAMQWDSTEIQQAVEGMGGDIAKIVPAVHQLADTGQTEIGAMPPSRIDSGFKLAASNGSVTLALETARQLRGQPDNAYFRGYDGDKQADTTLAYVSQGIGQLQQNTKALFERVNVNMAPISSPAARFGGAMTEQQMLDGIDAITNSKEGKEVVATMKDDRKQLDLQGVRLLRVGESVQFYRGDLGDLGGYKTVDRSRIDLLNTKESAGTILLSEPAARRIAVQTARIMLEENIKAQSPQTYGAAAQLIGDFPEFIAETYVLKGLDGQPKYTNVALLPDATEGIKATRIGHLPIFATATIWGAGGLFQAALTKYVYDNVHFDADEAWRKPVLMGLVGGFATFHLWEAGVAAARMRPEHFSSMPRVSEYLEKNAPWLFVKAGTQREEMTRVAVDATRGLTGSLAALMGIAVVWDASGAIYRAQEGDWWKVGTHGTNLGMDAILLRLQVREFAARLLPTLSEGALKSAATKLSTTPLTLDPLELAWKTIFRKVPFLSANPIGLIVNVGYLATALTSVGIDQNRYIEKLEKFDGMFLKGAGVHEPQAQVLDQHGWFSGEGKGDGLTTGYLALGGDPSKFVDYVNGMSPQVLKGFMGAAAELPDHVKETALPDLPRPLAYYLTLPADPAAADVDRSRIVFSEARNRYEDATTQMYFQDGKWQYFGAANAGPGAAELRWYDPVAIAVGKQDSSKSWTESLLPQSNLPATQTDSAFLALPLDPTKIDVSRYTGIHYNAKTKRYEDPVTQTYWSARTWVYDPNIGNSMGYVPRRQDDVLSYDPAQVGLLHQNGFMQSLQITSTSGLRNWMFANGVPMPPA